jgi:allantoin racemase
MRIRIIYPVKTNMWNDSARDFFESVKDSGTQIEVVSLSKGAESIEQHFDSLQNAAYTLEEIKKAQEQGFDAVYIPCFANIVVEGARELVDIPVVCVDEAACNIATMLGRRFSIMAVLDNEKTMIIDRIAMLGLDKKLASVRSLDIPVLDLKNREKVIGRLIETGRKAVDEDGADTLVLGCGSMFGLAEKASKELGVPVVDSPYAGLKMTELLVKMGLSHSGRVYLKPREKQRVVDY